jgi:hypothetical protein
MASSPGGVSRNIANLHFDSCQYRSQSMPYGFPQQAVAGSAFPQRLFDAMGLYLAQPKKLFPSMEQISLPERKSVCRIIRASVRQNPRIHSLIGRRLSGWQFNLITRQCAKYIRKKHGAVISDNGRGLAVILPIASEKDQREPIGRLSSFFLIPLKRVGAFYRFRKRVKTFMPTEPHLLFMLLVSEEDRNGMSAVIGVRDELFKLSEIMQLPVYAQTSSSGTRLLFESFGFSTYGRVPIPNKNEYMYFLKR